MSKISIDVNKFVLPNQIPVTKVTAESNPHRVTVGQVYIQPTGGKGTKPFNFTYGYFGMLDATGKHISGFSMPNIKMLEAVQAGLLSKDFAKCFEAYAAKHMAEGNAVIKTA